VRIVTGGGRLEHPIAGSDATFLQMLGLAQSTSPADIDYENRLWPRTSDPVFKLDAGAVDVRNGQSMNAGRIMRDQFLVFPSLRPFASRSAGLVVPGNPTNDAIYTSPGEYLYSPQHPASVYRISLQYETTVGEESQSLTLGATQMRPGSEHVLVDGRAVLRDLDYRIDYDLGRIDFTRPDTLFRQPRTIEVRFEENPGFSPTPTTLAGFVSTLPLNHGVINFTALNRRQQTSETRPQLGFQASSNLTAGVSGDFAWDAPALTRLASRLPFGPSTTASRIAVHGEIASSHPQFLARNNDASYVDDFEGAGGINIPLGDINWYLSSLPAYGNSLRSRFGPGFFEQNHAASIVWQTNAQTLGGATALFKQSQIDPRTDLIGAGVELNERVLWLTLLPLGDQGRYNRSTRRYDWTLGGPPAGRRFRSMRATLSPSGMDLTRGEFLELWTLVDTSITGRAKNPTLIFDFGDVSENSLAFAPETLTIRRNGTVDSLFTGRKPQGLDSLNTERDAFSKAFNFEVNDTGLPGDVVDTLVVIDGVNVRRETKVRICHGAPGALNVLGDPRSNCTIGNAHLDEEDIDLDNTLNFNTAARENERILRYVVDLSDPAKYKRLGGTYTDSILVSGVAQARTRRWALVSIPFGAPTDSLNDVNRRRVRAVRLTLVSGAGQLDDEPTQLPLAELRVTGAPWLDRSTSVLAGIAGVRPEGGFVITSTIGTNDSSATLVYQSPPGVIDQADVKGAQFSAVRTPINERSLRLQAGNLSLYHRAEAFLRFPAGPQSYTGFQTLRVWGRGRGNGWGQTAADLQMYIKIGRDENNFYMFRAPVAAGTNAAAWSDLGVDFSRLIALRRKIQTDYLAGKKESIACTGVDSLMIAASPPTDIVSHRFAACDDGYIAYTADPAVTAPNLAAVQELAVGILRVGAGGGASTILPGDTLELWVDDVRLTQPENESGMAQAFNLDANFGDVADLHLSFSNKDPNFRQLGEQPSFLSERNIGVVGTIRLDRFLPRGLGLALPLTINKVSIANDPLYLTQTDISASGVPGVRKPRTDLTNYSVTVRRSAPMNGGILGPLVNNISATTSYVTGVDRTEYQDGQAHNLSVSLDYLVGNDSARTFQLPSLLDRAFAALPSLLQAGPVSALRASSFRWNPTQLRLNSGFIRANDRRTSFIKPAGAPDDPPSVAEAQSRLWRNGSVLEFQPTAGLTARWEVQSVRDLRDYGDTTALTSVASRQRQNVFGANAGFERERRLLSSFTFAPGFSSWVHPRGELGTQYDMLRDPNARSLMPLPGVLVVDSILAARDSLALASRLTLARRMSAAQTASAGAQVDVAKAFATYARDSSTLGRVGRMFSPLDVSYTRSLLSALDAAAVDAPLSLQFGLGGPAAFRSINGTTATTSGQTGLFTASEALLLPYGTSLVNRFTRTTTTNWIARDDQSQAQVDGAQRRFPDASLLWAYRPAPGGSVFSSLTASAGFARSDVTVSLPSLIDQAPPEIRHTHVQTFPFAGSIAFAGRGAFSTGARYQLRRGIDSLPASVARSNGSDLSIDAGRVFHIPASWQLGVHDDLRTRFTFQLTHNTTSVFDSTGSVRARLQDNGRKTFTLTADSNIRDDLVLTFNGSHILTFDNNLNRRFEYTVFSTVFQWQPFGK
jgi:cell surface protein SprA